VLLVLVDEHILKEILVLKLFEEGLDDLKNAFVKLLDLNFVLILFIWEL
jgi:hypothetical protein